MKYRKKPVIIEAFQMTKKRRWDNSEWPDWLNQAWNTEGEGCLAIDPDDPTRERLYIGTLEGAHRVEWDDFIIQGVKGELYPCKPDIFIATYEEVSDDIEQMIFTSKGSATEHTTSQTTANSAIDASYEP